ncbi:MAG TPA: hypothetical protein VNO50_14425 [Pyrinomonadaceae bacterium]|nr:hypothetical protein [Pyrinomonadaceae bacterium]
MRGISTSANSVDSSGLSVAGAWPLAIMLEQVTKAIRITNVVQREFIQGRSRLDGIIVINLSGTRSPEQWTTSAAVN